MAWGSVEFWCRVTGDGGRHLSHHGSSPEDEPSIPRGLGLPGLFIGWMKGRPYLRLLEIMLSFWAE